jgi:hypothetical protein
VGFGFVEPAPLQAQGQAVAIKYTADQLNCARFLETSESKILTQSGGRDREQTSGRTGLWQFKAAAEQKGLALEGWLDSLALWRRSAETTIRADTDGLLGGRYRGTLSSLGAYTSRAVPFIPDDVAEIAGMATALDDFFPPLPGRSISPGQTWSGPPGVTIMRLPDSALSGVPLYRFALEVRTRRRKADAGRDSVPLQLDQTTGERGAYVWHPLLGLVKRERHIVVETSVPAGGAVRQAVRSRVDQRVTATRDLATTGCQTSAGSPTIERY